MSAESAVYQILVAGYLDLRRESCLAGWCVMHQPAGATCLSGPVRDMADLRGVLNQLFDWNVVLLEVRRELLSAGD